MENEYEADFPGAAGEHGALDLEETALTTKDERKAAILALIEAGMLDGEAAKAIGLSRIAVYRYKQDPEFLKAYNKARAICVTKLKTEAERRAMRGSDKLLMFLLCNYAPDQFRNTSRLEHTGKDGEPLISPEHAAARAAALFAAARERQGNAGADNALDLI